MPTSSAELTAQAQQVGQNLLAIYFSHLGWLEFLSIIVSIAGIAGIVYIVMETNWWGLRVERFRHIVLKSNISKKKAQQSWTKVQEHFFHGSESDLKVAILEADKLLNDALRDAGVLGVQLGDRLKHATTAQIPNLDEVWQAHRLRNQIAHEPNFKLKRDVAERALSIYKEAMANLGVLEEEEQTAQS